MYAIRRMDRAPDNIEAFLEEIRDGMTTLYGPLTGEECALRLRDQMRDSLTLPAVEAYEATVDHGAPAALVYTVYRDGVGRLALLHVLRAHRGRGAEAALVQMAVSRLQERGAWGITSEAVPMCPLNVADCFTGLGFVRVPRVVMVAPLDTPSLSSPEHLKSVPLQTDAFSEAAEVIASAYADHPDRDIQPEVRNSRETLQFIIGAAHGAYGHVREGYLRVCRREGTVAGVIVGGQISTELGFVAQVAVSPRFQGQGIGAKLLCDLAHVFRADGLTQMGLGVTAANPARRLYQRLGFRPRRGVEAFAWWQE